MPPRWLVITCPRWVLLDGRVDAPRHPRPAQRHDALTILGGRGASPHDRRVPTRAARAVSRRDRRAGPPARLRPACAAVRGLREPAASHHRHGRPVRPCDGRRGDHRVRCVVGARRGLVPRLALRRPGCAEPRARAALLEAVWGEAHRRRTITDAIQPVSNALYARRGLIPTTPGPSFTGLRRRRARPTEAPDVAAVDPAAYDFAGRSTTRTGATRNAAPGRAATPWVHVRLPRRLARPGRRRGRRAAAAAALDSRARACRSDQCVVNSGLCATLVEVALAARAAPSATSPACCLSAARAAADRTARSPATRSTKKRARGCTGRALVRSSFAACGKTSSIARAATSATARERADMSRRRDAGRQADAELLDVGPGPGRQHEECEAKHECCARHELARAGEARARSPATYRRCCRTPRGSA